MEVQRDFKELLALLNEHRVEYLIVGAYALAFHGAPRYTGDLDILVKADKQNAERILAALHDFGFADLDLKPADFEAPEMVIQLGVAPVRVDIITSLTGVDWEQAYSGRVRSKYGDIGVDYLGREQF
ncbi:MAG: nucleotidyltransferase domain-containing protein, partial [Planctomycetota bacterium]